MFVIKNSLGLYFSKYQVSKDGNSFCFTSNDNNDFVANMVNNRFHTLYTWSLVLDESVIKYDTFEKADSIIKNWTHIIPKDIEKEPVPRKKEECAVIIYNTFGSVVEEIK